MNKIYGKELLQMTQTNKNYAKQSNRISKVTVRENKIIW